jgi:hypothetical protein
MDMKRILMVSAAAALVAAGAASADPVTLYSTSTIPKNFYLTTEVWTNAAGETVSWKNFNDGNAVAYLQHKGESASSFALRDLSEPFRAHGLVVDWSGTWIYWDLRGNFPLELGAGGVDVKRSRFHFGYNGNTELHLSADQVWTGSGKSSDDHWFSVGGITGNTRYSKLVANDGVTSFGITGMLNAALYAPDNRLDDVAVTVSGNAKLWLADLADARLNAKKLVLDGDGVRMSFGLQFPAKTWYYPTEDAYAPTNIVAMDNFHLAPEIEFANGADVTAKRGIYAISNLTVSGTAPSEVSGTLTFTQAVSRIAFANPGASIAFSTTNSVSDGICAGFDVSGPGTLKLGHVDPFAGEISIAAGSTVELASSGRTYCAFNATLSGEGCLTVNADGMLYIPASKVADFAGHVVLASGTLVLDASLPEGMLEVRGGEVVYSPENPLVVTDLVKSESSITVSSNETMMVFGNGLTAATELKLEGGMVKFYGSSTIASPVTVLRPSSSFSTDFSSVTGTVSGFVTSSIPGNDETKGTRMYGPGCIRFTGGGDFSGKPNSLLSLDGSAVFDGGTWTFHNCMSLGCDYTAKRDGNPNSTHGLRWTVRGDTLFNIDGYNSNFTTTLLAKGHEWSSGYSRESFIDVIDGGTVELGKNGRICAGYMQARGTIRVANGGVIKVSNTSSSIILGYSVTAWGVLKLEEGGRIELSSPIVRKYYRQNAKYQPQGQIVWSGGTLKVNGNFPAEEASIIRLDGTAPESTDPEVLKGLRVWTRITGENCVLDIADLPVRETPLANVAVDNDRAEWFGTGTLTVKGGKTFMMNSFGSGLGLALEGDGTRVVFPDGVQIHDNAVCTARMNVEPGPARYSAFTNLLATASIGTLSVKGVDVSLVSENPTNTVSVGDVNVAPGALFSNGTITVPGGLSVANVTFDPGSTVGFDVHSPTLDVSGTVTLPGTVGYEVGDTPGLTPPYVVLRAGESVSGNPSEWVKRGSRNMLPFADPDAKVVLFYPPGTRIIVR